MGVVFVFMAMFMLSTFDVPRPVGLGIVTPKAEFLVELTWQDGSPDDIDLYGRGPDGAIIYFGRRDTASMFLDIDNRGKSNAVPQPGGGSKDIPDRREIMTIRAIVPGEYVFNAHFYSKDSLPGDVARLRMTVTKINPYRVVTVAEATFDTEGEEKTMVNFKVDAAGEIGEVYLAPVKMVGAR
ncbi:MAG: hypothetical protein ACAH27_05535 [Xanthobacteraceae bacterium]